MSRREIERKKQTNREVEQAEWGIESIKYENEFRNITKSAVADK